jgi:dimethylhistidine N-methyltransferase
MKSVIVPERDQLTPVGERFLLYRAPQPALTASFADDVRAGLTARQKHLAPKYFYDDLGSALFEAICELPEYYLTRVETQILERHAGEMIAALDGPLELVEFGSGSARKTRVLVAAALEAQERLEYHPIDISASALIASAGALVGAYDRLSVSAYASDYVEVLSSARLRTSKRVLALFLGSNIGNYRPDEAAELLSAMSASFKPGDGLLLGTDLKKDAAVLERAYNDPTGVTAAFDKNLLARINRELGGRFDLDGFGFAARYDAAKGSVDSYLVAERGMVVPIDGLGLDVSFRLAETIHTESSFKFDWDDIARLAARGGFRVQQAWTDDERRYAVSLLVIL